MTRYELGKIRRCSLCLPGQDSKAEGLTAMLTGTSLDLAQCRLPWFLGAARLRQLVAYMPMRGCPVNSDVMVVCAGSAVC